MPLLVNPEPLDVRTMERWSAFRERLHAWPVEKLRARAEEFCEKHPSAKGRPNTIRRNLAEADKEGELADALILAALRFGEITAYISHPPSNNCYAIERFTWRMYFKSPDALRAIEDGVAPWPLREFVPQRIEHQLADRPLFVRTSEANAFLKLRLPSQASIKKASKALVAEHRDAPLKKAQFISLLTVRCAGCSANRAGQAWKLHVPSTWRRPGRRRRTD